MKKINIAIDGPSAAGKSTIADAIALKTGYIHLDTGAMYRCLGLKCLRNNVPLKDEEAVREILRDTVIGQDKEGNSYLDGENVSLDIRKEEVSLAASDVSTLHSVREFMVSAQQQIAEGKGYILDGRDIGTVVLKDAELKIFLTASVSSRALRRYKQNMEKGIATDLKTIEEDIEKRDYQDTHRKYSPLRKAEDAVLIDTSDMTKEEVAQKVFEMVKEKIKEE